MRSSGRAPQGLRGRSLAVTAAAAASGIVLGIGATEGLAGSSSGPAAAVSPPSGAAPPTTQLPPLPGAHPPAHANLPPLPGAHPHVPATSPNARTDNGTSAGPVSVSPTQRVAPIRRITLGSGRSAARRPLPISAPARAVTRPGNFAG